MSERTWLEVKAAVNACLLVRSPHFSRVEDPVKEFYDNNLPCAMNDVAVYAFLNGEDKLDPKLVADIRDGFAQVNTKGFIGPGVKD